MTTTQIASLLKNSPTQWFGDRGLCQNCGIVAHEDRQLGTIHTGTRKAACEPSDVRAWLLP